MTVLRTSWVSSMKILMKPRGELKKSGIISITNVIMKTSFSQASIGPLNTVSHLRALIKIASERTALLG